MREAVSWADGGGTLGQRSTGGAQRGGGGELGPRRRAPCLAYAEVEQQIADRDALAADKRALPVPYAELHYRRGDDQCCGPVADRRLADADEIIADAQIKTTLECGGDFGMPTAPAQIAGNDTGAQHRERRSERRAPIERQAHCAAAPRASPRPTAASASAAASAFESATITPAASSLRT